MDKYINFNYNFNSDIPIRVENIRAAGFDGIFLYSEFDNSEHIDIIKSKNLKIETLHLPYKKYEGGVLVDSRYVNVLWGGGDEAERYVDELCAQVEWAGRNNIKTAVMHITGGEAPPPFSDGGVRCIERVLKLCKEFGIVLCLENLRRLDYLKCVFDSIKDDNLKFCFDSGHANAMTHNLESFPWETYGDKLYCLHLNDNFGEHDSHLIPMQGNIRWKPLLKKLFGFNPTLNFTLEVRADRNQLINGEDAYLRDCMNGLNTIEKLVLENK